MIRIPRTKAELLEENNKLIRNAIVGWFYRMRYILGNSEIVDQHMLTELENILREMEQFSGED